MVEENKHRCDIMPDRRRSCPECGSKTFTTSLTYGRNKEVVNGKIIINELKALDAGSFSCGNRECDYYETY